MEAENQHGFQAALLKVSFSLPPPRIYWGSCCACDCVIFASRARQGLGLETHLLCLSVRLSPQRLHFPLRLRFKDHCNYNPHPHPKSRTVLFLIWQEHLLPTSVASSLPPSLFPPQVAETKSGSSSVFTLRLGGQDRPKHGGHHEEGIGNLEAATGIIAGEYGLWRFIEGVIWGEEK